MSLKCVIRVIEARGIKASDLNGKSDPYIKVNIKGSSKVQRTRTIFKTLSPVWNEEFVIQPINQNDVIELTLWDHDAIKDDYLGQLSFPLNTYLNQTRDEWKPILERHKGVVGGALKMMTGMAPMRAHGEIHLQIFVGNGNPSQNQQPAYQPQQSNQMPNQYGMSSNPAPSYASNQIPQYGPSNQYNQAPYAASSQPPQYGMTTPTPAPAPSNQYASSAPAPQNQFFNTFGIKPHPPAQYPVAPSFAAQSQQSNPSQYPPSMAPVSQPMPMNQTQNGAYNQNMYRSLSDENLTASGQFPSAWGPKPDFSTLDQPRAYGAM